MRAICLQKYGSLNEFKLTELPTPEPKKGEVRVRVHTSSLNPADYKVALGLFKFLHARNFPMTLGYDFSGVIDAVGPDTSAWKVGDAVFGFLPYGPANRRGAFAEMLIANQNEIAFKPVGVSHAQAAASATGALTAIQSLRDLGKLPLGGRALVTGVSGSVGSTGIMVAKKMGAQVTALGSGRGLELAKKLGADEVIDRKKGDVFKASLNSFDVVFDAAAAYRWTQWSQKIKAGGCYVTTLPSLSFAVDKLKSFVSPSSVGFVNVKSRVGDLQLLASWLESGMSIAIDSTVPVREVGKGLDKLQQGHILGRIVVDVMNGF